MHWLEGLAPGVTLNPIDSNDPWNDRSQFTLMTLRMVDLNDSWNGGSQLTLASDSQ